MNEIVSTVTDFSESTRQRRELDHRPLPRSAVTAQDKILSYTDLQRLIHMALRIEHPEWIGPDGESEMCDFYEARFAKLLGKEILARKYHLT